MDLTLSLRRGWRDLRALRFAAVLGVHPFGHLLLLLAAVLLLAFATLGQARATAQWSWIDIASEGGLSALMALWLAQLRASRPPGPVTSALCLGLAAGLLGNGVDLCDEFWSLPKAWWWDNLLESGLNLLGMVALTWGLHGWRREQLVLNEQLRRRERDLRDHRRVDPVSSLADADYMAAQIERSRAGGGALLMLGLDGLDALTREAGLAEADRLLANAAQLLCLNLGADELVCRYAGARFVLLLPGLAGADSARVATQLERALAGLCHVDAQGRRWNLPVRAALQPLNATARPDALMQALARRLT